jgi:hypothetical protein
MPAESDMNMQRLLAGCALIAFVAAFTPALADTVAPTKLPKGAACVATDTMAADGPTHHCWFVPHAFGKRNFSTRNGRAQYIFSELDRCNEIEILSDAEYPRADGEAWRVVALRCFD